MAKERQHVVTVQGGGEFPVDMLRYDRLAPYSESDSYAIAESIREGTGKRTVQVTRYAEARWTPTVGRWESFGGWKVVGHDIRG